MERGEHVKLVEPTAALEAAFLDMAGDYRTAGEERYQCIPELVRGDFAAYVNGLWRTAMGVGLRAGWVPTTTFWTVRNDTTIIGVVRLRHRLTPSLHLEGGHIGYDIRPSERNKGYGTLQLALTLEKARQRGLSRVLVTCDTDNVASAKIIQKNGGQFEGESISPDSGQPVSRYWIDLA